ncbi:MAG TPA: hypothetical protein VII06_11330 [Chloroflexota bacterium]|jgi:hypothetical protein
MILTSPVHPEALLESGYALLLLAIAVGFGQWSRHSQTRLGRPADSVPDTGHAQEDGRAPWPQAEIARFHHGIALLLVLLAAAVTVIGLIRHHEGAELLLLGVALALTMLVGQRLLPTFLASQRTLD